MYFVSINGFSSAIKINLDINFHDKHGRWKENNFEMLEIAEETERNIKSIILSNKIK